MNDKFKKPGVSLANELESALARRKTPEGIGPVDDGDDQRCQHIHRAAVYVSPKQGNAAYGGNTIGQCTYPSLPGMIYCREHATPDAMAYHIKHLVGVLNQLGYDEMGNKIAEKQDDYIPMIRTLVVIISIADGKIRFNLPGWSQTKEIELDVDVLPSKWDMATYMDMKSHLYVKANVMDAKTQEELVFEDWEQG